MKLVFGLLATALAFAGPLDDTSIQDVEQNLPQTIVVKDGDVVGTLAVSLESDSDAELAMDSAEFPEIIQTAGEKNKDDYLSDSSGDSYYYYRGYYHRRGHYGYYHGRHNYHYRHYYSWRGYRYYRYSYRYSYRARSWRYRYYWW